MTIANLWNVDAAEEIIFQVTEAVHPFATTARRFAVQGGKGLENISADIRRRLKALAATPE